jgi:hypothetical protein
MFYTSLDNLAQKRTIKPLYAHHQATPQGYTLDSNYNAATYGDIYPGMVMKSIGDGTVTLCLGKEDGTDSNVVGLSAHFYAPALGIDEVTDSGLDAIGVWVLGADAQMSVLAPAFDTAPAGEGAVTWSDAQDDLEAGTAVYLVAGAGAHNYGKLTPAVPVDVAGNHAVLSGAEQVCRLVEIISDTEIIVAGL